MEHRSTRVTPNNQQDMWVKYLIRNLRQIDDLEWCQSLLVYIDTEEHTFNTGKFRGALFHLNFQASERKKYRDKITKISQVQDSHLNSAFDRMYEREGRQFASMSMRKNSMKDLAFAQCLRRHTD